MSREDRLSGVLRSINRSDSKGTPKTPVPEARLLEDLGLEGDAHAGPWHRMVSLLAMESIATMRSKGLDVGPGDFAENLTTEGISLVDLPTGSVLRVGERAVVRVTQIGKTCHDRCAIYEQAGDCVMPREGIFAEVVRGGVVRPGDRILIVEEGYDGRSDKEKKNSSEEPRNP